MKIFSSNPASAAHFTSKIFKWIVNRQGIEQRDQLDAAESLRAATSGTNCVRRYLISNQFFREITELGFAQRRDEHVRVVALRGVGWT
jgi:hypothetical protein